jgi:phosphoribosylaminoimidazole-succinocarboxamide synthase
MGKEGQTVPEMTPEFCNEVSQRYIELYEHITGLKFQPADASNLEERIEKNLLGCLDSLAK